MRPTSFPRKSRKLNRFVLKLSKSIETPWITAGRIFEKMRPSTKKMRPVSFPRKSRKLNQFVLKIYKSIETPWTTAGRIFEK